MPEIAPPTPAQLAKLQKAIDASDPEFGVFVRFRPCVGASRATRMV
jgi:hypothetical protein